MYIPKLEPNQTSCDIYTARAGGGASNCRLRFASTSAYAGLVICTRAGDAGIASLRLAISSIGPGLPKPTPPCAHAPTI